jgi:hypothetical protein
VRSFAARQRIAFMNQLNALSNRVEYYAQLQLFVELPPAHVVSNERMKNNVDSATVVA